MHIVGPDVADRHDLHVFGVERPDQHAAFIAGADDRDAERVADGRIAEIFAAGRHAGSGADADDRLQKVAALKRLSRWRLIESAHCGVKIFFPGFPLFGRELVHRGSP